MVAPGVYPKGGARPTTSRAEQSLYRALAKTLPEGWIAWHSLRVRADRRYEGETDFVVAIPTRGLLVLEVKGGAIEIRDGRWLQNGRAMPKAPRDQALRFAAILRDKLRDRGVRQMPWTEVVTAFPETPFSFEPTEGAVAGAVLGQQDLSYLDEALLALAERLFAHAHVPRDDAWLDALHAIWCETWAPSLRLGDRARLREKELVALDAEQLELLDAIAENPRMLVRGGAGTGKTLVAREIHDRMVAPLAEQGREPLFLCSTRALAVGLRSSGTTHAWTVREYAAELLERAAIPMQQGAPRSAWTAETWAEAPSRTAREALGKLELRHGAIVVDEGQDMSTSDWELVRALAGDGVLWIFADAGQSFWVEREIPSDLVAASFTLLRRYRCPEPLARFADLYRHEPPPHRPSSPLAAAALGSFADRPSSPFAAASVESPPRRASSPGSAAATGPSGEAEVPSAERLEEVRPFDELRLVTIPSGTARSDAVASEIATALGSGARPSDIAVLSLAGQTRSQLAVASRIGSYGVVRADDARADDAVIADTFLRFKGLERPWVVVTELSLSRSRYDVRMHVALTRATVGCVVVATEDEIEADPRLSRVARGGPRPGVG